MMTAEEANAKSTEKRIELVNAQSREMDSLINNAIEQGLFECNLTIRTAIQNDICELLNMLGYQFSVINYNIDRSVTNIKITW